MDEVDGPAGGGVALQFVQQFPAICTVRSRSRATARALKARLTRRR